MLSRVNNHISTKHELTTPKTQHETEKSTGHIISSDVINTCVACETQTSMKHSTHQQSKTRMEIEGRIHQQITSPTSHHDPNQHEGQGQAESFQTPPISQQMPIKWPKPRLRLAAFLSFSTILFVTVAVGVSRIKNKPTVHITFPAKSNYREVRMFSNFPDLTVLSKNHTSLSLVSRLQLLDAQRCRADPETCKISVVCDRATGQEVNCRCRTGFYFKDWKCRACSTRCSSGHYLASPCSTSSNAVCRACTICSKTQYVAAPCNTNRDTICIDVSFPAGFLPMNRSHLPDDGIQVYVGHSPNVFVERLIDQQRLENSMYITNNQQVMEFVWDRLSSLSVSISVSGVFLVPEYHDVDAVDDTKLFTRLAEPTQHAKYIYSIVQNNYCRHPVPDYYALQLEIAPDRTSAAKVVRCDSKDNNIAACPPELKDGDRFLDWEINTPCAQYMQNAKLAPLNDGPNSVVCKDETPLLRKIFNRLRPTTQEFMFPSVDCQVQRRQCQQCLTSAKCVGNNNGSTMGMFGDESRCCGIACFSSDACKKVYSTQCPKPEVECAKGEVNIFSLFPVFDTMERQFSCHLKYKPPKYLYKLSYTVRIPSLGFNSTGTSYVVGLNSRQQHQRKLTRFDFLYSIHDTGMPLEDEILMIGDHRELRPFGQSLMKPYTIRRFKTPEELNQRTDYQYDSSGRTSYIQLEKPFQYSSFSWYKDGCYKNMSRIFPNQTLHSSDFLPVEAKKGYQSQRPGLDSKTHPGYAYQMYRRSKQPFVKLSIGEGQSILQYLQGKQVKGKMVANSLHGQVTWHYETGTWRIVLTGEQDSCPSIVSIKIFTQLMTGCAGHFDVFIDCPETFTVTFNFSTSMSDLPDIFVLQINDSTTSHRMVLSSMYAPLSVEEARSEGSKIVQKEKLSSAKDDHEQNFSSIWQPLLIVVIFALVVLFIIVVFYHCVNVKARRVDMSVSMAENEMEIVALNNHNEKQNHTPVVSIHKPKTKWFVCVFIVLYIIYCLIFSFCLTSGIVYLTYRSAVETYSQPKNSISELEREINKSVLEIEKFEHSERLRLFQGFEDRRQACMNHLEKENKKLLEDYQETTQKQVADVFMENGTLHQLTNQIQRQNVSMYMFQISQFLTDCNKTIHSIIDRFESNYLQFLKKSVLNDWLKVPRQIFLVQDGEDPDRKFLSSTQVKQFATWLEIDKVGVLLAARDNMVHRLNQVKIPSVSSLDMTFPSVTPDLSSAIPDFQPQPQKYTMTVLDPDTHNLDNESSTSSSMSSSSLTSKKARSRRETGKSPEAGSVFGLSGNVNPASDFVSNHSKEKAGDNEEENDDDDENDGQNNNNNNDDDGDKVKGGKVNSIDYSYDENDDDDENTDDDDSDVYDDNDEDVDNTDAGTTFDNNSNDKIKDNTISYGSNSKKDDSQISDTNFDNSPPQYVRTEVDNIFQHDSSSQNLIDDSEYAQLPSPVALASSDNHHQPSPSDNNNNSNEDTNQSNGCLYILIAVFVTLDVVLMLYRISWLSNQLYAAKHGYADRIPTDDACKQVLEIQTAYHLPAFNGSLENTGTYVDGKEQLYGTEKERDNITFLQPLPNTKNDDILQQIWNEKTIQSEDRWAQRFFLTRWFEKLKEIAQRVFLSQLVWQACVTFLAIIFISILLYAVEFWLVPANFRTLVGSQSVTSDLQWQLDTSGRYLHTLARQLTHQLARIRHLCDMEVAVLTEAFFSTVNIQTSAFTVSLQKLCDESKGKNCERLSVFKPSGGRIVGCNFLPLQAQTFHDLSLSNIEELVSGEVTPFLHLSKRVISTSSLVIVSMLCLRLLCQVAATTVRHYLLLTGKLPRVKVYQSEEPSQLLRGVVPGNGSAMQRSQSWVDSCESGVYVGEVEDPANKEEQGAKVVFLNS